MVKHIHHIRLLHNPPGVHHRHPVAHPRHNAKIVGDKDDGRPRLRLNVLQQPQVLQLDGGVQRGGGFVRNQQVGRAGDGYGAHHPLPHPAAHLMRKVRKPFLRRGDADIRQQLRRPFPQRPPGLVVLQPQRFRQLVAYRKDRVQRGQRILHHHTDARPADVAHLAPAFLQQVLAQVADAAAHDAPRVRHHPQDGPRRHALAGAGFAHDAQRLAPPQLKGDAVHRLDHAGAGKKVRLQILHPQDGIAPAAAIAAAAAAIAPAAVAAPAIAVAAGAIAVAVVAAVVAAHCSPAPPPPCRAGAGDYCTTLCAGLPPADGGCRAAWPWRVPDILPVIPPLHPSFRRKPESNALAAQFAP